MASSTKVWFFLAVAPLLGPTFAQDYFNMTEYFQMPPLARLQNFEKCMEGTHDLAIYCSTTTYLRGDPSNPVWEIVQKYANDRKRSYRHDVVRTGICVNWCQEELGKLDQETLDKLYVEKFPIDYHYRLTAAAFNETPEFDRQYGRLINQCINLHLREKYGLEGYTRIVFCTTNRETSPIDTLDAIFLVVLGVVILTVTAGTLYDRKIKKTEDHYKKSEAVEDLPTGAQALLAFSLPRNWYRLISQPTSEESRVLRYVQGFRFITIYLIVWGHALIGYTLGFITNPYKYEESFHSVLGQMQLNAFSIVQAFFSISGLLMGYQFAELSSKRKFNGHYFWIAIVYRYLRLTPVFFFMMLFDATWLYKLQDGPTWKRLAQTERYNCRTNMWTNLLYINNYVNVQDGCMPVTWYLAVEFQMFIVGLAVMMLIWRWPKIKKTLLTICVVVSLVVPAIVTYFGEFDGIFLLGPEDRKFMQYARSFIYTYVPSHMNMGNYFFGIITGLYCFHVRSNKIELSVTKKRFILWSAYLAPVVSGFVAMTFYVFYAYDFPKPSLWQAAFSMFTRNLWGFFGVFTTCAYVLKIENFIIHMFQMKIFQPLGRLTYCIYLCHFDLMRVLAAESRENITASNLMVGISALTVYFFATIIGLVLCLCLEFPTTSLLKQFIKRDPEARKEFKRRKEIDVELKEQKKDRDANGNLLIGSSESLNNNNIE